MTKEIKQATVDTKKKVQVALYNLSVIVLGTSFITCELSAYKYAQMAHLNGFLYRLVIASVAVMVGLTAVVLGKWLINKPAEIK
jgi:hypothetical protein